MRNENQIEAQKQKWFSADAWENADDWDNAEAEEWEGADDDEEEWNNAEGLSVSKPSSPFIIKIVNASSSAISNVDIGDSFLNRAASNFNQNASITISSSIPGVNYIQFLGNSETQPFKIGKTMIISTSSGQIEEIFTITHGNAKGDRLDHSVIPTIDPNQQQTDRILENFEYLFDGYTRLRFNQINGSATVVVRLYPVSEFKPTQIVAGRPSTQVFSAPSIIKPQVMVQRPMRGRQGRAQAYRQRRLARGR